MMMLFRRLASRPSGALALRSFSSAAAASSSTPPKKTVVAQATFIFTALTGLTWLALRDSHRHLSADLKDLRALIKEGKEEEEKRREWLKEMKMELEKAKMKAEKDKERWANEKMEIEKRKEKLEMEDEEQWQIRGNPCLTKIPTS